MLCRPSASPPALQPPCVLLSVRAAVPAVPLSGSLTPTAPHHLSPFCGPQPRPGQPLGPCLWEQQEGRSGAGSQGALPSREEDRLARPTSRQGTGWGPPPSAQLTPVGPPRLEAGPVRSPMVGLPRTEALRAVGSAARGAGGCEESRHRAGGAAGEALGVSRDERGLQSSGARDARSRAKPQGRVGEPGWAAGEASKAGRQVPGGGRAWGGP